MTVYLPAVYLIWQRYHHYAQNLKLIKNALNDQSLNTFFKQFNYEKTSGNICMAMHVYICRIYLELVLYTMATIYTPMTRSK